MNGAAETGKDALTLVSMVKSLKTIGSPPLKFEQLKSPSSNHVNRNFFQLQSN
jgi:hypothetical protein